MRKFLGPLERRGVFAAFGHDLREFALLWIVFANLDVFVQNHLTVLWIAGNLAFSGALWITGAYIELFPSKEER